MTAVAISAPRQAVRDGFESLEATVTIDGRESGRSGFARRTGRWRRVWNRS